MVNYKLYIGDDASGEPDEVLEELTSISVDKSHSALSSWDVSVPFQPSLQQYILDDCWLYNGNEKVYRGVIESFDNSNSSNETTITGRGREVELAQNASDVRYTLQSMYDVIDDFGNNETYADWNVIGPETEDRIEEYGEGVSNPLSDVITTGGTDEPTYFDGNGFVRTHKTAFTEDAQNLTISGGTVVEDDRKFSGGEAAQLTSDGDTIEQSVSWQYTMDGGTNRNFAWVVKMQADVADGDSITVNFYNNGTLYTSFSPSGGIDDDWYFVFDKDEFTSEDVAQPDSPDGPFTLELTGNISSADTRLLVDATSVINTDFSYEFPQDTNDSGYYDGPREYARNITVDSEVNPGAEAGDEAVPYLEVHQRHNGLYRHFRNQIVTIPDGGTLTTEPIKTNNPDTVKKGTGWTYEPGYDIDSLTVKHYLSPQPVSEQTSSGEVDYAGIDKVAYVLGEPQNEIYISDKRYIGDNLEIVQEMADFGEYRFTVADADAATFEAFPVGYARPEPDWRILEDTQSIDYTDYANKVTFSGGVDENGEVVTATSTNQDEIDELNKTVHKQFTEPSVTNKGTLQRKADEKVNTLVANKEQKGSVEALPKFIESGYRIPVGPWGSVFTDGERAGVYGLEFATADSIQDTITHYTFNEDEIFADDTVENRSRVDLADNDGIINGSYSIRDSGAVEEDILFNGTDTYVTRPVNEISDRFRTLDSQFSINAFITPLSYPDAAEEYVITERGRDAADGYNWYFALTDDGSLRVRIQDVQGDNHVNGTSESTLDPNTTHHVGFEYDSGNGVTIYIDGEADTTLAEQTISTPNTDNDSDMHIGADGAGVESFFDGYIDDVRVYERLLTTEERNTIVGLEGDENLILGAPDRVEGLRAEPTSGSDTDDRAFEVIIFPTELDKMDDNEFQRIIGGTEDDNFLVLNGDGSLTWNAASLDAPFTTAESVIENNTSQQVTLYMDAVNGEANILVDGVNVFSQSVSVGNVDFTGLLLGNKPQPVFANAFTGGIDDFRIWYAGDGAGALTYDFSIIKEDLTWTEQSYPSDELVGYWNFENPDTPNTAEAPLTSIAGTITGPDYDGELATLEEVSYSLGNDGSMSVNFNIRGYLSAELSDAIRQIKQNKKIV